ncbi:hypothetical protein DBV15_11011, partial [Temnothorax longispinosus]
VTITSYDLCNQLTFQEQFLIENIGKMKFVIFTIFIMIAMAIAYKRGKHSEESYESYEASCVSLSHPCRQTSECCRNLKCQEHANICVQQYPRSKGDTRPRGRQMPY